MRALVVEDEALVAMLIEGYLADSGFEIAGSAARLGDALEMARTMDVDVAVLDVNLDGELSYPVAEALRARGVPFVFATGYGVAGLPDTLRGAPVVAKPLREEDLAEAVRRVVEAA